MIVVVVMSRLLRRRIENERYFEFTDALERRTNGNPNFQYIITTTEPPPERFKEEPYLRLKLDASRPEDRFLKCNL